MGKNQHQQDRMHITSTEWRRDFGGFKEKRVPRVLPLSFDCCSISLLPFKSPVCTTDGNVFDKTNIREYIDKFGKCPVTGKSLKKKDLIKLNFSKNEKGKLHCPLTFRVFNDNSYIVAIKTSGNVFSHEAVEKLNIKPKFWEDVLDGTKFRKEDIITLQNPNKIEMRAIENFDHVIKKLVLDKEKTKKISNLAVKNVVDKINSENVKFTGKRLPKREHKKSSKKHKNGENKTTDKNSNIFTTFNTAASFTSTSIAPSNKTQLRKLSEEEKRSAMYQKMSQKKECKAYVRLHTSLGDLNFELDVKRAPMTCHNFLLLAAKGYYDETHFHRLIVSFVVQGGDPEGTGFGGECAFGGKKMKDEIHKSLKHNARGILSMANSGPNSNGSQFFITFGAWANLDGKHSVFGKLVGGMETLNNIERVKTEKETDEPIEKITILKISIYQNPFDDVEKTNSDCEEEKQISNIEEKNGNWFVGNARADTKVGKYLDEILAKRK